MNDKQLTHGSLFSGIGGFDLAAEWAEIKNIFQVEIDGFCQQVLKKNFPSVKKYKDIKEFNGKKYKGRVNVISGGFPCQPYSIAGNRKGKNDDRALWKEMLRVITEIKPRWIIAENVTGIINMELDDVLDDLGNQGYKTEVFVLPAAGIGAPHQRQRVWIVANNYNYGSSISSSEIKKRGDSEKKCFSKPTSILFDANPDNSIEYSSAWRGGGSKTQKSRNDAEWFFDINSDFISGRFSKFWPDKKQSKDDVEQVYWNGRENWIETAAEFCGVDDGVPKRVDRLKSLGNAVVPQIPYILFQAIKKVETIS